MQKQGARLIVQLAYIVSSKESVAPRGHLVIPIV